MRLRPIRRPFAGRRRPLRAAALLAAVLLLAGPNADTPAAQTPTPASAPALATATSDVALRAGPDEEHLVIAVIPEGTEVELTGSAEGAFVEVIAGGRQGWASAAELDAGHRTDGIRVATTTGSAPLRVAPEPEAEIRRVVPAGGTIILTGAEVGGFVAASYEGTGGWIWGASLAEQPG